MEKTIIKFDSEGETGNIFYILAIVRMALRKQRRISEYNEMLDNVHHSSSYKEALNEIRKYVTLIDVRNKY